MKFFLPTKFLLSVTLLAIFSIFFFAGGVYAVSPIPKIYLPCDQTNDQTNNPEFDSLRPYQAAPCGTANKALYCSNTLTFVESFDNFPSCRGQAPDPGCPGSVGFLCHDPKEGPVYEHTLRVSLDNSMLPILGNTELVQNSQTSADTLDNATKMNEYASWYLNGVNNRAEYGSTNNTDDTAVNFSGPIQKIMPQAILDAQRIQTITNPSIIVTSDPEGENAGKTEPATHNQIAVCFDKQIVMIKIFGLIPFPTLKAVARDCYAGNNTKATTPMHRLQDWQTGNLGLVRGITSKILDVVNGITGLDNTTLGQDFFSSAWKHSYPPLPWADEDGKPFISNILYEKAHQEWEGKTCVIIPLINVLACLPNPLINSEWADLFSYVPLANTTDKLGLEKLNPQRPSFEPGGGTLITPPTYSKIINGTLYFPHTQEVKELSDFLNKSYTPQGFQSQPVPSSTGTNNCSAVDIRVNPGDNLFPGDRPDPNDEGIQIKKLAYTIIQVPCVITKTLVDRVNGKNRCSTKVTCHAEVTITMKTQTKTPWANEIFASTVADSGSTFRRIYPKVVPGAPVSCIADIPTTTNVTYDESQSSKPPYGGGIGNLGFNITKLPADAAGGNTQLTFPHIGSVYAYFLKGIQTALRPLGYADPNPPSATTCQTTSSSSLGSICAVADAYHIPCCQLKGVAEIETGSGATTGSSSCSTKNGPFQCCNGNVCGPSQITCSQYDGLAGNDKIDMCDSVGSSELLSRAMLLALCQAAKKCNTYDWEKEKSKAMQFSIQNGDYTAAAYFYGLNNGCTVSACSQYRWGAGKGYCNSLDNYCKTGQVLPDNTSPEFCAACNQEVVRGGQAPIDCSRSGGGSGNSSRGN